MFKKYLCQKGGGSAETLDLGDSNTHPQSFASVAMISTVAQDKPDFMHFSYGEGSPLCLYCCFTIAVAIEKQIQIVY